MNGKFDKKTADALMSAAEKSFGKGAVEKFKGMDPKQIDGMLKKLSEDDMSKLENVLKNPAALSKLLTPENTAKIKKILEE